MTEKLRSEQLKVVKARVEAGYDNEDARYLLSHIAALEAENARLKAQCDPACPFSVTHPTTQTPKVE